MLIIVIKIWKSWLKEYWKNRVKNIPLPLEDYEYSIMIELTLNEYIINEAVDLVAMHKGNGK